MTPNPVPSQYSKKKQKNASFLKSGSVDENNKSKKPLWRYSVSGEVEPYSMCVQTTEMKQSFFQSSSSSIMVFSTVSAEPYRVSHT